MIASLLDRFKEPSSWAGVAVILNLFGVQIAPEGMTAIVTALTGACAVAAFFIKEKAKPQV